MYIDHSTHTSYIIHDTYSTVEQKENYFRKSSHLPFLKYNHCHFMQQMANENHSTESVIYYLNIQYLIRTIFVSIN